MRFAQNGKVVLRNNNKVSVFACAKDFSTTVEMTGRTVETSVKKPLSQPFELTAPPLVGGAENKVERNPQSTTLTAPLLKGHECGASRLDPSATLSPTRGDGVGFASREMTRRTV
jgi:hypothetical protein